ncbi:cupin domain-containing protein [Paraburkholderia sp. RL18-103-BIB-C]|jgi:mannose-6-phosphate isomerase-like protein (cupin superfamily)|uniref:cupin domain-containing protein n=1 Tax=unclassified Paraburkholderia TaxID=2615204 RepID=UPI0038BD70A5
MENELFNFFDINSILSQFPDEADSTIVDVYLTDEPSASSRIFRVYYPIPRHYHETCEEHLYLLTGKVAFAIEDEAPRVLTAGQLVTFERNTVHAITEILESPAIFFTVDAPRRVPTDVVYVNPDDEKIRPFVTHLGSY